MVVTCSPRASAGTRANEGIGDRTEEISSRSMLDADLKSTVYKDERPKDISTDFTNGPAAGRPERPTKSFARSPYSML
jgi:hypothetical protein